MIKKILLILAAWLFAVYTPAFSGESSSIYIAADLTNPRETSFNISAEDKFTLEGIIKKNRLLVTQGKFTYKKIPFYLNADMESSGTPKIKLSLSSEILKLAIEADCDKESITVRNLSIDAKDSWVQAAALLNAAKHTTEISGRSVVELAQAIEIASILGISSAKLENAKPEGSLETDFNFTGDDNLEGWEIKTKSHSEKLKIRGIEAENLTINLLKQKNNLIIESLSAQIYKGSLSLKAVVDLAEFRARASLDLKEVDISEAVKKLGLKKNLSGTLSLEADLKNIGLKELDKMDGEGKISVKGARLWEITVLKNLGRILSIPEFENIVFKQGSSNLIFSGKDINFKGLCLSSAAININGQGRLDLEGKIDFDLSSQFSDETIDSSQGLKKYITDLLAQTGLNIKVYGTIKKPKYRVLPAIPEPAEKIKSFLEELIID